VLVLEGKPNRPAWVLVEGDPTMSKGDVDVSTITPPGAIIGEESVLLGHRHGATAVAMTAARIKIAHGGLEFLGSKPAILRLVAAIPPVVPTSWPLIWPT
jgi:hypothetical protein